ncbi:hypothetical protein PIB30_058669, partial [Stylosanthes scabra]|nr:hypothetical protein [Stylosanthes scabra]
MSRLGLAKPIPKRDPYKARGQVQAQDGKSRLALLRPNVTFLHSNVTKTKPPQAYIISRLGLAKPSPK